MIMRALILAAVLAATLPLRVLAEDLPLAPMSVTEWKAVSGRIEAKEMADDEAAARSPERLKRVFEEEAHH